MKGAIKRVNVTGKCGRPFSLCIYFLALIVMNKIILQMYRNDTYTLMAIYYCYLTTIPYIGCNTNMSIYSLVHSYTSLVKTEDTLFVQFD